MQGVQKGKIGITVVSHWFTPLSRSKSDVAAARRQVDFMLGWYILCDHCSILSGGKKRKKKQNKIDAYLTGNNTLEGLWTPSFEETTR